MYASMITASIKLSMKKEPIKTRETQKRVGRNGDFTWRCKLYRITVQLSRVII